MQFTYKQLWLLCYSYIYTVTRVWVLDDDEHTNATVASVHFRYKSVLFYTYYYYYNVSSAYGILDDDGFISICTQSINNKVMYNITDTDRRYLEAIQKVFQFKWLVKVLAAVEML